MSTKWTGLLSVVLLHTTVWAAATLENPAPGAVKSGVGLISGWICEADRVEVSFDGGNRLFVPSGSERVDTAGVCGDTANGFGLLTNYNELGDGPHTVTLYADGAIVTQVTFSVQTPGTAILRGVYGGGIVPLSNGVLAAIQWEEATQNFAIVGYGHVEEGRGLIFGPEGTVFWPDLRTGPLSEELDDLYGVLDEAAHGCRVYGEVDRRPYSQAEFLDDLADEEILSYAVTSDHALTQRYADPFSGPVVKKVRCVSGFALFWEAATCQSRSGFREDLSEKVTLEIFYSTYADYDDEGNRVEEGLPRWEVILHLPFDESIYYYLHYVNRIASITIKRDRFEVVASYYDEEKRGDLLFNAWFLFPQGASAEITAVTAYDNQTGARLTLPTRVTETLTTFLQNVHKVVQGEDITPLCPK